MVEKNEKGITLIALIITIIVLLILAGVSIAMLTGENGILSRAESVSYASRQGEMLETIGLAITESIMSIDTTHSIEAVLEIAEANGFISDEEYTITKTEAEATITHKDTGATVVLLEVSTGNIKVTSGDRIEVGDANTDTTTIESLTGTMTTDEVTIKDADEVEITIPGGFGIPANSTEDPLEDRDSIAEGFVIEDSDGNQFVWVPANSTANTAAANLFAVDADNAGTYTSTGSSSYYEPYYGSSTSYGDANSSYNTDEYTLEDYTDEFNDMQKTTEERKGFYISRYEISYGANGKAESKKGVTTAGANYSTTLRWWGLYNLARSYENGEVKSTMISLSQYDIMIGWFTDTEITESGRNATYVSGTNSDDKIRNIYDLTGSKREWTTGGSGTYSRVYRGGDSTNSDLASYVTNYNAYIAYDNYSSRFTLIW